MAGPKQRGRGKTKKRTYAKKDPTVTKKGWKKFWEEDAALYEEAGLDTEWDKEVARQTRLGKWDLDADWDWGKDLSRGKFESGRERIPDMRDYRNRMTLQDIMGPPIHEVVDPRHKKFQQDFFNVNQDLERMYPGFKKFRNQMNLRNFLLEPMLEEGGVKGRNFPSGISTISPDQFDDDWDYSNLSGILGEYARQGVLAKRGWDKKYADIATGKFTTGKDWKGSKYEKYTRAPGTIWHEALHGKLDMPNEERAIREMLARAGILEEDVEGMHELGYRPEQMAPVDTSEVYSQLGISPASLSRGGIASLPTRGIFY